MKKRSGQLVLLLVPSSSPHAGSNRSSIRIVRVALHTVSPSEGSPNSLHNDGKGAGLANANLTTAPLDKTTSGKWIASAKKYP